MAIETLEDWNTRLGYCGCCVMPSCPTPTIDCQVKEGAQSAYLWLPFKRPDGESTDDIPALYRNRSELWSCAWTTGAAWLYQGWEYNPTALNEWNENLQSQYFRGSKTTPGLWELTEEGNGTESDTGAHLLPIPYGPNVENGNDGYRPFTELFWPSNIIPYYTAASDYANVVSPEKFEITAISYQRDAEVINYVKGGGPPELQGAGGEDGLYIHNWDVEETESERYENWFTITKEDIRNDALIDSGVWPEPPALPSGTGNTTTACSSRYSVIWPTISVHEPWPDPRVTWPLFGSPWRDAYVEGHIWDVRYRWKIPHTFDGSYFKITWDVLTEPDGWNDTINDPDATPPDPLPEGTTIDEWWADHQVPKPGRPSRSYVQDLTAEWIGPGTGGENDPSWFTDWNDLNPPPMPGTRRVVNIRYECYRGPYGAKPQTTGEGVDISNDTPLQKRFTTDRHAINYPLTY